jgi:hypothetical protein
MYEVETSLEINASTERVWDVLTLFRQWDEWNPIITRVRATLSPNTPMGFTISIRGRELKIKAEMVKVEPGKEIRWRGPSSRLLGSLARGEHYLVVERAGVGKSRIVHGEQFGGLLLPIIWRKLEADLRAAYSEMNRAIKVRAEGGAGV